MNITTKIKDILSEQLGFDKSDITPESRLDEDLGVDSLDLVEIVMAIEGDFDLDISDKDAMKLVTVQDVIDYVTEATE